jgi:predicted phosphodiesterase
MNKELTEKFKQYLQKKKKPYIDQICVDLGLQEYEVYGLIEILKNEGYLYDIIDGKIIKVKPIKESELYQIPNNLDHLKLLLISDTHLASKYDRLDILNYLYDEADKKGVNYVLHSGDLTEGLSGRPQQLYELKEASYTGQRDYVIDKYPKTDIPTYVIAGNHDQWWIKQCGADICRDISNNREDLIYLGSDCEDLKIGKLRIRLYHGTGGGAYAKSYKLQKYLDSVPMEERPHILQTGHIHQAFYMKQGNTHCFQTSCLQDQTPYERSKGLSNDKSCWWVDVYMDNKGNPVKINQELETFGKKLIRRR